MADETSTGKRPQLFPRISDRVYFIIALIIFGLIILVMLTACSIFMNGPWASYDTGRFYAMAEEIVHGATPYLDYQDPKTPLLFYVLTVPVILGQKYLGGLLLVGLCNLISAALVMKIGWELYGRAAGLLAGLLFVLNIGWAQGYFVMTEPFTITFILLASYFAFCGSKRHYFLAGISAGLAIGFKQYALITVPLLAFGMYLNKDLKRLPVLVAGVLLPLAIMFGAILVIYGSEAFNASIYWSFGIAASYMGENNVDGVTNYRTSDPLMWAANIAMATSMFTSVIIIGLAGALRDRKLSTVEVYFVASAVCFALTILIRQYLHYWVLALPFFALLCARLFRDDR
jgi:4-amino-4-deoxy-L-arabinose transferase-like glycosyltransferase